MRILCICSQGQHRSRILANLLADKHETRYGGIDTGAPNPITQEHVDWAEVVIFARERHQKLFHKRFGTLEKEFCLDVTDNPEEISEDWRQMRVQDPDKFYKEYTYPRLVTALDAKTFDTNAP